MLPKPKQLVLNVILFIEKLYWKNICSNIPSRLLHFHFHRGSLSNSLALFWQYRTFVCSAVTPCTFEIKLSVWVGNLFYFSSFMKMSAGYLNMSTAVVYSTVHAERLVLITRWTRKKIEIPSFLVLRHFVVSSMTNMKIGG